MTPIPYDAPACGHGDPPAEAASASSPASNHRTGQPRIQAFTPACGHGDPPAEATSASSPAPKNWTGRPRAQAFTPACGHGDSPAGGASASSPASKHRTGRPRIQAFTPACGHDCPPAEATMRPAPPPSSDGPTRIHFAARSGRSHPLRGRARPAMLLRAGDVGVDRVGRA
jgi:hypothetical protein